MSWRSLLYWIGLVLFGVVCGAGIQKDLERDRAAKAPIVQKIAEIEKRVVYLVDDLRACKSAVPVVCTCETIEAGAARAEEQAGRSKEERGAALSNNARSNRSRLH